MKVNKVKQNKFGKRFSVVSFRLSVAGEDWRNAQISDDFEAQHCCKQFFIYWQSMIKTIGYSLFVLSCLAWLMILIIPFLGFSKGLAAGIITVLIIIGELTFYASILLLGKAFYIKIREKIGFRRKKSEKSDPEENLVADSHK